MHCHPRRSGSWTAAPPSSAASTSASSQETASTRARVTHDPRLARATRLRLCAEHLEQPEKDVAGDPAEVIDTLWRPLAEKGSNGGGAASRSSTASSASPTSRAGRAGFSAR
jgi:hypothetical protein